MDERKIFVMHLAYLSKPTGIKKSPYQVNNCESYKSQGNKMNENDVEIVLK